MVSILFATRIILSLIFNRNLSKTMLYVFLQKEKLAFSLYLLGIASYFPQHCLYFLPLPHGTHKSAYFNTLIFLKPFIYGLFSTLYFLILPLKSSVCGSKSGSNVYLCVLS